MQLSYVIILVVYGIVIVKKHIKMSIFNNIGVNKFKMKKTYNSNVLKEKISSVERNQNKLLQQMVELNSSIKEQEELIRLLIANKFLDSISNKVVTKKDY